MTRRFMLARLNYWGPVNCYLICRAVEIFVSSFAPQEVTLFVNKKPSLALKTLLAMVIGFISIFVWSVDARSQEVQPPELPDAQAADDFIIYRLHNLGTRGPDMDEALTCGVLRDLGRLKTGTLKAVQCRTLPRDNAFKSGYYNTDDIRKFAEEHFHDQTKSTAWLEIVETKIRDNARAEHPEYAQEQYKICEAAKDATCAGKYRTLTILGFEARAKSGDPKAMVQLVELMPKTYFETGAFLIPAKQRHR